jgi:transposase
VDGHPAHRARATTEFVASTDGRLKLFLLPAYSPELNPDEWVWRASHIPDTGPNKVRSGMEVDHCENVVASSVRNSRTRP